LSIVSLIVFSASGASHCIKSALKANSLSKMCLSYPIRKSKRETDFIKGISARKNLSLFSNSCQSTVCNWDIPQRRQCKTFVIIIRRTMSVSKKSSFFKEVTNHSYKGTLCSWTSPVSTQVSHNKFKP
jgi:hypothetical protein